jgi:tetratricopeptide (TPR) repeat protein
MSGAPSSNEARVKELRASAQKILGVDHFAALNVSRTATPDEVKKAFIEAVKSWHPDRVPQGLEEVRPLFAKVFARLELARATITDAASRAKYIEDLAKPDAAATASDISSAEAGLELRKAEGMLKKNDTAAAERHLRRAVQLAPSNVECQVLLVWLQAKPDSSVDRLRGLVVDLDRLIARDPASKRAYYFRGMILKRLDDTKKAMADFARAAELDPQNVDAARELRIYRMRQEKSEPKPPSGDDGGVGGFFRKLFKK